MEPGLSTAMTKPFHMDVTERVINPSNPSELLAEKEPIVERRRRRRRRKDCDCSRPTPGSRFCSSDIHTFFDDHTPTILTGDLNAKHTAWGSRVVSLARRQLLQDAADYGYEVLGPDTPSHVPTDPHFRANVLNSVLCHRLPFPIHVEDLFDMDTQHLILITLDTIPHLTPARPQTHRTNWSAYQRALEELHVGKSFSSPEEVDLAALHLNHEIQTAYGAATIHLPAPTCRRWDRPPCLGAAWEETIGQAGEDWKSLRQLCRRLTKAPTPVCPLLDKTGIRRYAAKDPAEILSEHLKEQFTLHPASDSHPIIVHHEEVERREREFLSTQIPPLPDDY
ncbi:Probable RNA-directed DNA polymerase from transposon BS [Eumeta japonica]|uniref:Probable RNA-directed DNA polymerase from transposon BS n=1 Tax=Eumeta variegata TaxID=151549 RepID=A0A4C1XPD7_EUMVA|nr:Probable RNA-directed DNA polymerase from transposon BS [Eumeta japonica]